MPDGIIHRNIVQLIKVAVPNCADSVSAADPELSVYFFKVFHIRDGGDIICLHIAETVLQVSVINLRSLGTEIYITEIVRVRENTHDAFYGRCIGIEISIYLPIQYGEDISVYVNAVDVSVVALPQRAYVCVIYSGIPEIAELHGRVNDHEAFIGRDIHVSSSVFRD